MKTAAPLPAGTLLANGRYQLQQVLGQGGFAITYLALDTQLKRTVAIKELCPQGCIRDAHNQVAPITLPPTSSRRYDSASLKRRNSSRN